MSAALAPKNAHKHALATARNRLITLNCSFAAFVGENKAYDMIGLHCVIDDASRLAADIKHLNRMLENNPDAASLGGIEANPAELETASTGREVDPRDSYEAINDSCLQAKAVIGLIKSCFFASTDGAIDYNAVYYALNAARVIFEQICIKNNAAALGVDGLHPDRVDAVKCVDAIALQAIESTALFSNLVADELPLSIGGFIARIDAIMLEITRIEAIPYDDYIKLA